MDAKYPCPLDDRRGRRAGKNNPFRVSVPREHLDSRAKHSNFYRLVTAYREHAHKQANIDPVASARPSPLKELDPTRYGLERNDVVAFEGIISSDKREGTVEEAINILNDIYSDNMGAEFTYLEVRDVEKRVSTLPSRTKQP